MNTDPKKVAVVEEPNQAAEILARLISRRDNLEAIPDGEMTLQQIGDLRLVKAALKMAKRAGVNPQGKSSRPRPNLAIGQEVKVFEVSYWVAKVKADGRLRLTWSGYCPPTNSVMVIEGMSYIVTAVGARQVLLRPVNSGDFERDVAEISRALENMEGAVWTSAEIDISSLEPSSIKLDFPIKPVLFGPTKSQLARQKRKENRARGVMERKMRRAAERAPAGSIGAAMAGSSTK